MSRGTTYSVTSREQGLRVLGELRSEFNCVEDPAAIRDETSADTFEWLIYRDGGSLAWSPTDGGYDLVWSDLDGTPRHRWRVRQPPGLIEECPEGPFRRDLEAVIDVRRLLPIVRTRKRLRPLRLIDRRAKTTVRVELQHGTAWAPEAGARGRRLPVTIHVRALRGYETAAARVRRFLEQRAGLVPDGRPELLIALDAIGRQAGDVPARQDYPIDAGMRTDQAMKAILGALLDTLERNLDGLCRELDIEFLHDARVAVRRQRSALGQVKHVFDRRTTERLRRDLAWIGRLTGDARDLDVHLLEMRSFAGELPDEMRAGLDPLVDLLTARRRAEQRRMVRGFDSRRFRRFAAFLREFVAKPVPARTSLPNATRPIHEVAAERVRKAHRRLIRRGSEIDDDTPAERLHRLRIDAKKLRYLLEFFAQLFAENEIKKLVKALKGLQDHLGLLNDLAVQRLTLRHLVADLPDAPDGRRAAAEKTVEHLSTRLAVRHAEERRHFRERFARFADRSVTSRFERLFGRKKKEAGS
jgi:CHAD domain-containing protein